MYKNITAPLDDEVVRSLKAGDNVHINGIIYCARDAAHKKIFDGLMKGENPPFDIKSQIIYYAGPCPAKPGHIIGSAGPTTSGRMDKYTPALIAEGLKGMIGKGMRSKEVIDAMKQYKSVYFAATGGAGALIAATIKKQEIIAYDELGAEAVRKLWVENFPVIVVIDCEGNNLYESEPKKYSNMYGVGV